MGKEMSRMFGFVTETWNPIVGCKHNCVYCWAKRQARRQINNCQKCGWFTPHIHRDRLKRKFKANTLVFVCDLADIFSPMVSQLWVPTIFDVIRHNPETTFFLETKNPWGYVSGYTIIPKNTILSVTLETNRSDWKIPGSDDIVYKDISSAPYPVQRYFAILDLKKCGIEIDHLSIEPILDFDLRRFCTWIKKINPDSVSIGYDNYNNRLPEPPLDKTIALIEKLEFYGIEVEKKQLREAWWEKK